MNKTVSSLWPHQLCLVARCAHFDFRVGQRLILDPEAYQFYLHPIYRRHF